MSSQKQYSGNQAAAGAVDNDRNNHNYEDEGEEDMEQELDEEESKDLLLFSLLVV